jgi:signal peptidase I
MARKAAEWLGTIAIAAAFVLAFEAEVAKPYRIPSASMEPTLHCARPGPECLGRFGDRVIANRLAYRVADPRRGQIVVFVAPPTASRCGGDDGGKTFVPQARRAVRRPARPRPSNSGMAASSGERVFLHGRQPLVLL